MNGMKLMDRSRYNSETKARDAAWDALVDGFVVVAYPKEGVWVVEFYARPTVSGL